MSQESEIRSGILKQADECTSALQWEDDLHNKIAMDLVNDECVRGEITAGGNAIIYGIKDIGRAELRDGQIATKLSRFSKKLAVACWTVLIAVAAYIVQLECVKTWLSDHIGTLLK